MTICSYKKIFFFFGFKQNPQIEPGWNTWTNPNLAQSPQAPINKQPLLPPPFASSSSENSLDVRSDSYWQRLTEQGNRTGEHNSKPSTQLPMDQFPSAIDAAKRKTLPNWIRY